MFLKRQVKTPAVNVEDARREGILYGIQMQRLIFEFQYQLPSYYYFKLIFEYLVAFLILLFVSPLMIAIAFAIRLKIGSPIIHKQLRVGECMKPFWAYKFRTMNEHSFRVVDLGYRPLTKIKNDPRVAGKLGAFLRKWKWDELPQLFNILKGEMTLIGPRPYLFDENLYFAYKHYVRFSIRPGMSGLWQARSHSMNKPELKTRLDCLYAKKLSFKMDFWIWLRTFYILFKGERF